MAEGAKLEVIAYVAVSTPIQMVFGMADVAASWTMDGTIARLNRDLLQAVRTVTDADEFKAFDYYLSVNNAAQRISTTRLAMCFEHRLLSRCWRSPPFSG